MTFVELATEFGKFALISGFIVLIVVAVGYYWQSRKGV